MPAMQPRDTIPAICSASMTSLSVGVTAIAESAMRFIRLYTTCVILNTTICSVRDLCIVQTCCFLDLLLDDSKCVHLFTPESRGCLIPVPSVVCVPVVVTLWC